MSDSRQRLDADSTMAADRLESWKEIAAYLRRGVRTAVRWEKEEGLPVHRHVHHTLGSVYALKSELEAWRDGRRERSGGAVKAVVGSAPQPATRVLIAILPFENLSGAAGQAYFADGLTEEMISQLGRFSPDTLSVIARTTMMQYKGVKGTTSIRRIAKELKVDYVMEGSVRCEGERVRVTAQLIDGRDQTPRWSGTYEQPLRSILGLQRDLAADIGREIRLKLSPERRPPIGPIHPVKPEAYVAHLKGRHLLSAFTPASVRRSVAHFKRSINAEPTYAPAYASLAEAYEQFPIWADAPAIQTVPLALKAAEQALLRDPHLPEAYVALGLIHANYLWDWLVAERHYQRALELNPSSSSARQWYGEFLGAMGRTDEALVILERSKSDDPLSLGIVASRAFALLLGHRFDEAISEARRALEIDPKSATALIRLALGYAGKGLHEDAVQAFRRAAKAAPGLMDCSSLLGYTLALAGDKRGALAQLEVLRRLARRRYVPAFLFANVHVGLGDHERALRFFEKEYEAKGWYMLLLKCSPVYDPLRSHPRFRALVRRMKFP
jgi:TolB-like protein/tetratricopeptide (TPR) repeat protein